MTPEAVQGCLELAALQVSGESCKEDAALQSFYQRTVAAVRQKQQQGDALAAKYAGLKL